MPYTYEFPQASPCSAVLMYTREGNAVRLLTTIRAGRVGLGRSLSAGGFYEVKDMFKRAAKVRDGNAELYREVREELGREITKIIPYADFNRRVEYLWDGMRRLGETPAVHNIIFKTLEITPRELSAILALKPTKEQKGKVVEAFSAAGDVTPRAIKKRLHDFHYPIEVTAAQKWYGKVTASKPMALAA